MTVTRRVKTIVCIAGTFKVGDPRPSGYLDFFEWARVQHRGGLRQRRCRACKRWNFPQETCCTRGDRRERGHA